MLFLVYTGKYNTFWATAGSAIAVCCFLLFNATHHKIVYRVAKLAYFTGLYKKWNMKKITLPLTAALAATALLCGCKDEKTSSGQKFIETANMDSSVKPGDNFFLFVNGKWDKKAIIPAAESGAGAFYDLYNHTKDNMHTLLTDVAKSTKTPGSLEQKVGDFYISGMDTNTIDKRGYEPVKPYLQKIDGIKDAAGVMQFTDEQQTEENGLLFNQGIAPDDKNSSVNIAEYTQGGIGLPDREYYFKTDARTVAVVNAYKTYIRKMFMLTGTDSATADKKVAEIFELERKLAESHKTNVELRDPNANYHKMAVADLDKQMPVFAWKATLSTMGVKADSVNVQQPAYYAKLNELLKTVPVDVWKDYLRFHLLSDVSSALGKDFADARFDYLGRALNGQEKQHDRWENMVQSADANLGDALGQLYVKKYFNEDAKKRIDELVNNLQTAFDARISKLDWMSDSTKVIAKDKLHAFLKKIGYTNKWRDYSSVTIDSAKYFENLVSCSKNDYAYQVAKVGKPVDRMEWDMTPPTINAGYYPTFNAIVFPAGILQFPFFDPTADDAINYGGIGMVIGHEMTHGFDDQGAQYDKDGNLKNWWGKDDYAKFTAKSKKVIDLYNSFTVLDTMHLNGALTTGENIADIGGLAIAYDAFKMTKQGQDTTKIDGLTPDQRFFLSIGQIWREKLKDQFVAQLVNTDPHSPAMYRVNGPLMNFEPFYKAFNVQPGDKMYVADSARIKIW